MMLSDKNPLKIASASIATVVAILGSIWAIDSHYASAADVNQIKAEVKSQLQELQVDTTLQTYQLRREMLRDKIEDLNLKEDSQKLTPYETRQRDRYVEEVRNVDSILNSAQRSKLGLTQPPSVTSNSRGQPVVSQTLQK